MILSNPDASGFLLSKRLIYLFIFIPDIFNSIVSVNLNKSGT
jgi:hypothetical protein